MQFSETVGKFCSAGDNENYVISKGIDDWMHLTGDTIALFSLSSTNASDFRRCYYGRGGEQGKTES